LVKSNEMADMLVAAGVKDTNRLFAQIEIWESILLKSEQAELYIESPGSAAHLFSETMLMVIRIAETNPEFHITFYPLNGIKSCELKMNGLNEECETVLGGNDEVVSEGYIELNFEIRNKQFRFYSQKPKYARRILSILANKILPNIKG